MPIVCTVQHLQDGWNGGSVQAGRVMSVWMPSFWTPDLTATFGAVLAPVRMFEDHSDWGGVADSLALLVVL